MKKIAIIFHSRYGHTERVAEAIKRVIGAASTG
jgi:flavodoxin